MDNKAKLSEQKSNGKNYAIKKELTGTEHAIVNTKQGPEEIITLRYYMSRSNRAEVVYASIWIHGHKSKFYTSGTGEAGGGGYDKTSAAAGSAIESAGISLKKDIQGVGETAVHGALKAIVKAMGYTGKCLIVTN